MSDNDYNPHELDSAWDRFDNDHEVETRDREIEAAEFGGEADEPVSFQDGTTGHVNENGILTPDESVDLSVNKMLGRLCLITLMAFAAVGYLASLGRHSEQHLWAAGYGVEEQ